MFESLTFKSFLMFIFGVYISEKYLLLIIYGIFSDIMNIIEALKKKIEENQTSREIPETFDIRPKGNEAYGKVLKIATVPTRYKDSTYMEIDGEFKNGKKKVKGIRTIWLTTVLENQVNRLGIKEGDYIGIKSLGKTKNYYNFKVVKG